MVELPPTTSTPSTPPFIKASTTTTTVLWARNRNNNRVGNKKGGSKTRSGPSPRAAGPGKKRRDGGKKEKKRSLHEKELEKASQRASVQLPSSKSRAPPWRILSPQDTRENVKVEKKRRELAKQGVKMEKEDRDRKLSKALLSDAERSLIAWRRFNPSTVPCGLTFVGSYLEKRLPPRLGVPEIAFLGRSNVGKSSLLNKLATPALTSTGEFGNDEARVGKTPGATASVNMYVMMGKTKQKALAAKPVMGFVDLPGFGYAKLSREIQESVQEAAERYLSKREELALGILLVDARRTPSEDDRIVLAALYDLGVPLVVVATKVDKLGKNEIEKQLSTIQEGLGLPDGQPLCVSSATGEGTKVLWRVIMEACEIRIEELQKKINTPRDDNPDDEEDAFGRQHQPFEEAPDVQVDAEGNLVLPYDDGQPLSYSQGFDWIQGSSVMYEPIFKSNSGGNNNSDSDYVGDGGYDFDSDEGYFDDEDDEGLDDGFGFENEVRFSDLKKKARKLERQGEV